ncbi:MAG TPA: MEDS domain-containing protein [Bryobacteraceae bacterium]|nr:MEDS domain-containing protein [Bryobacteraceae bacterium]
MGDEQLRPTGIGVVGDVPWGTHFFLFHETKEDLIEACVPYFRAGLENGELCIWAITDPLTEEEVRYCLRDAIPGFENYFESGGIEIVRGREWYMTGGDLNLEKVTAGWKQKTERALNGGYAGFRLSADTAWLDKRHWKEFCEYEKEVNDSIVDTPMLALCTYPLPGSAAAEILDVTRTHQFAIARRNKGWEVVETSELKQAKAEILRLNNDLERRVVDRTRQLTAANEELRKQMSERQRAEDALRSAQAELARVTRVTAMGELAASIAHEVTQPLTGIVTNGNACLHWLASTPPNVEKARTTVERIIRDSNLASDVIHNVRTLVKKTPPHHEPVALNDLVYRTLALASGEITRHQVELQTVLADDLPNVMGDRVQLQQVLLNLIINAVEAMSSITGWPRVLTVRSERREAPETITIAVRDSGVGLDPLRAERLFDAFFTTKPEGMGLGLSICRNIISAHGGRLSNANNADHGATFEFTLPAYAEIQNRVDIATV